MAIVYSTEIQVLRGAPNLGELKNVIKEVEFLIKGEDGEIKDGSIGHIKLDLNTNNFTALENIEKATVIGWIESHPCYDVHKAIINRSIQEQKIPTNVVMEKPWL